MCGNCRVNASGRTTSVLTWAVPVNVVKLGASLQAYKSLRLTINQFRLCNRFGNGPYVFVTQLPQELVDMVLEYLIIPQRKVEETEWEKIKRCAENRCVPLDHFEEEEIDKWRLMATEEGVLEGLDADGVWDALEDYVDDMVGEMDSDFEICKSRKARWEVMTCVSKNFAELDKVLGSEFGLSAHIAHQSLTGSMIRMYNPTVSSGREGIVTQAYLTLPCRGFTSVWNANEVCSHDHMDYYDCEGKLTFFNVIDPTALQITKEKIQRFRRAMRFLGLSPSLIAAQLPSLDHEHPDPVLAKHKDVVVSGEPDWNGLAKLRADVRKRLQEEENSEWPKVMNLVTSAYELFTDF